MNIHSSTVDSEAFLDASDAQQGRWLRLFRFCAGQENGGTIKNAAAFDDRKWSRLAGLTSELVREACSLWQFDGADLVLNFYPRKKEEEVQANRKNAAKGGKARAQAYRNVPPVLPPGTKDTLPPGLPPAVPSGSAEGKGREGKGMEEEGNAHAQEASHIPSSVEFEGAFMADGIPVEYLSRQFEWFHEKRAWLNGRGELVDWRRTVRNRWAQDRATWRPHGVENGFSEKKPARSQSVASLKFELDRRLAEVRSRLDDAYSLNLPAEAADVALERDLKKKRAALDAEEGVA